MSRNPYERRVGPRRPGEMSASNMRAELMGGPATSGLATGGVVEHEARGLTIRELHAMVASAYHRGGVREREAGAQEERNARREAWDEGYQRGEADGETAVLANIDRQFGEAVRDLHDRIEEKLAGEGPEISKRDLLHETMRCLEALIEAHHRGFAEPAGLHKSIAELAAETIERLTPTPRGEARA